MTKNTLFLISSIFIHLVFLILFVEKAPSIKKKRCLFKEKIVIIPNNISSNETFSNPPKTSTSKTTIPKPSESQISSITTSNKTHPQQIEKKVSKPVSSPQAPSHPTSKPETKKNDQNVSTTQQDNLRKAAQAIDQLSKKLEDRIEKFSPTIPSNQKISNNISLTKKLEEEDLYQILEKNFILPEKGSVRLTLTLASNGELINFTILSSTSEVNSFYVTSRLPKISFQELSKKYELGNNVTFRVKLVSKNS